MKSRADGIASSPGLSRKFLILIFSLLDLQKTRINNSTKAIKKPNQKLSSGSITNK